MRHERRIHPVCMADDARTFEVIDVCHDRTVAAESAFDLARYLERLVRTVYDMFIDKI